MTSDRYCRGILFAFVWLCTAIILLTLPQLSKADYLGLFSGRPASVKEHDNLSLDIGAELLDNDQISVVRINRKIQKKWMGSAHIGLAGKDSGSGFALGAAGLYSLTDNNDFKKKFREKYKEFADNWNLGLRGSAAVASFRDDGENLDAFSFSASAVASSRTSPRSEELVKWYVEAGLELISSESLSAERTVYNETTLLPKLSLGFIYPFLILEETVYGFRYGGEVFGGLSLGDTSRLAVGFRYNLK